MAEEKKKKKKTFKDIFGMKATDFILPAVVGGIGSYSNAAGRGVGLGLQAMRTFQAGREYNDERRAGKALEEQFSSESEAMAEEIKRLQEEEAGMTAVQRIDGQGAVLPNPKRPVSRDEFENVDPYAEAGEMSLFEDGSMFDSEAVLSGLSPEQAVMQGADFGADMGNVMPTPDITQQLIADKQRRQEIAEEISGLQGRKGFYDMLGAGASANPSTAMYVGSQEMMDRMRHKDSLAETAATLASWSENNKEKYWLEANMENLKADKKMDVAKFEAELQGKGYRMFQTGDELIWVDPSVPGQIVGKWKSDKGGKMSISKLAQIPIEDRFAMWLDINGEVETTKKRIAEQGGTATDKQNLQHFEQARAELWASLDNAESLTSLYQIYEQLKAIKEQAGMPVPTFQEWLKSSGVSYGGDDLIDDSGGTDGNNPYTY